MLCRKCKKEIPQESTFCNWCGAAQTMPARKPKARGNGQGTVYQLPNGKWRAEIRVYSGGIRRRATKSGFARKKDALDYLPHLLPKQRQKIISFCELFDKWSAKKFETISKSKAVAYKIAYKRCEPLYHIKDWAQVRLADMQEIVDDAGTFYPQRDIKQLLNAMGEYAIKYEFATENLAPYIELAQYKTPEREVFTDEEIDRLWKAYEGRGFKGRSSSMAGYILLMIYTGLRVGELQTIKKEDVNLDERYMMGGIKTELSKQTPIAICEKILPVIREKYIAGHTKLLEMGEKKFYDDYYEACRQAGIRELTPYSCRHTYVTRLTRAGVDPAVIKKAARHEKYETTLQYTHMNIKDTLDAVNKL